MIGLEGGHVKVTIMLTSPTSYNLFFSRNQSKEE